MDNPAMPKVVPLLSKWRDRAVDAAIVDALPHLDEPTAEALLEMLIKRSHVPSHAALVSAYGRMSSPLRDLVSHRATRLSHGIRAAITSADLAARRAGIDLVVTSRDVASSHLLADALRKKCAATRQLAAEGLLELTRVCPKPAASESPDAVRYAQAYRAHLAAALAEALSAWDLHQQRPALLAALYLGEDVLPALRRKLGDPKSHIARTVSGMIEGTTDTRLAGFVLRALAIEPLHKAAISAITQQTHAPFIDAVLRETWLLADPQIEQGCRRLRDGPWSTRWRDVVADANETLPPTAVGFLASLGGTAGQRVNQLATLLAADGETVRRTALWRLIADESEEATELLVDVARRAVEPLSELASRECRRRRPGSILPSPAKSPAVADAGIDAPATTSAQILDRFIEEFDALAPSDRRSLGEQISSLVGNLPDRLHKYLRSSDPPTRAKAVSIVAGLGLAPDMSETLFEMAHDPDGTVRSATIAALRAIPGATTTRILREALNDPQPRVQANAVEALEALGLVDRVDKVAAKLHSASNRTKANAIKALLRMQFESAAETLLEMLEDDSQAHRLSALWVVERMGLRTLVGHITRISRSDPDRRVRIRAGRVLRALAPGDTAPPAAAPRVAAASDVTGGKR